MLFVSEMVAAGPAAAQTGYPERAIRLIVPFPAGGPSDIIARLLGQRLADAWGKPLVIENVPGAAGNIGAERVAMASPDGYTLALVNIAQIVINPSLYKLPYDPVKDFAPITQLVGSALILVVHPSVPAKNVRDLVALARSRPGELTFASGGSGNQPHLAGELLKSMTGIDITHIPYKGVPLAMPDLLTGRVTIMFGPIATVLPLVREAKLRGLAVTGLQRSSAIPQLPTMEESGFRGFETTSWFGLLAPGGTPAPIVRKIHLETVRVLLLPDVRAKISDLGMQVIGNTPDEFAAAIKAELPRWAKVIKETGIKAD
jgi:tripartite-type tricarboxylate transporter receptor subunit TctC